MSVHYFNRIDREQHIVMMVFNLVISEWLDKNKSLTKEERRYIKTGLTWLKKGYNSMIARSDPKYIKSLKNTARHCDLFLEDNTGRVLSSQKIDTRTIALEDFYDLSEFAMEGKCSRCKDGNKNTCESYDLFIRLGIPPFCEDTDGCPYKQPQNKNIDNTENPLYNSNIPTD